MKQIRCDKQTIKALHNINMRAKSQPMSTEGLLVAWLKESLQEMREQNDHLRDYYLDWNQGGCQTVQSILTTLNEATEVIKNSK